MKQNYLRQAVEKRKRHLIHRLLRFKYFENQEDTLYSKTLSELESEWRRISRQEDHDIG